MTNHSPFAAPFPDVSFVEDRWLSWPELCAAMRAPNSPLSRLGVYVVAYFPEGRVPSLQLPDQHVVYIGETHGRRASLTQRLTQFGTSAGFFPDRGQQDGHYGAWGVPKLLGQEIERGRSSSSEHFYFAAAPVPVQADTGPRGGAWRGVYPPLVESALLWDHVQRHGQLPDLNSSGRQVTVADEEVRRRMVDSIAEPDLAILLDAHAEADSVSQAAARAAEAIAAAWAYRPSRTYADSRGARRHLGKGKWLYINQEVDGALSIRILGPNDECHFGPPLNREEQGPASDPIAVRKLLECLWLAFQ